MNKKTLETLPFTQQELNWLEQGLNLAMEQYKDKTTRNHMSGLRVRIMNANPTPQRITVSKTKFGGAGARAILREWR